MINGNVYIQNIVSLDMARSEIAIFLYAVLTADQIVCRLECSVELFHPLHGYDGDVGFRSLRTFYNRLFGCYSRQASIVLHIQPGSIVDIAIGGNG